MHRPKCLQVVNGSVYIAGESPSYESRLLNLKRQLFRLWLDGGLPDGIDVRVEGAAAFSARYCLPPPLLHGWRCCHPCWLLPAAAATCQPLALQLHVAIAAASSLAAAGSCASHPSHGASEAT